MLFVLWSRIPIRLGPVKNGGIGGPRKGEETECESDEHHHRSGFACLTGHGCRVVLMQREVLEAKEGD